MDARIVKRVASRWGDGARRWPWAALLLLGLALPPRPAAGIFHLAVIDEVMTSYDGDPDVQFVEVRMLAVFQIFVTNTVIGAFDADGAYLGDVLVLPNDVANDGAGLRWLMGTSAFAARSGLAPDFVIPPSLPTGGGMVCWGAPGNGLSVPNPASWDHADPNNYTDCLAYGSYGGPPNEHIGTPIDQNADGHSLARVSETNDNASDFACTDEATPTNNSSESVSLAATAACAVCGNGSIESPVEQCDGADDGACPGACRSDCQCPAVCGDGVAEAPEACDGSDDGACPGQCQDDCRCPVVLDSFKCYAAKDLKSPKFAGASVSLADELVVNDGEFAVKKPALFCPPASVDGAEILQPSAGLTCYKVKGPKLDKADRPALQVEDDFGALKVQAVKPSLLCVPETADPPVVLDSFKCYAAKDLKSPKFAGANVSLSDGLAVNDGAFVVKKPAMFCAPTALDGEEIAQAEGRLTCYKMKGPKLDKADRPAAAITDRFGSLQVQATKPALLCRPSTVAP